MSYLNLFETPMKLLIYLVKIKIIICIANKLLKILVDDKNLSKFIKFILKYLVVLIKMIKKRTYLVCGNFF